MNKHNTSDHWLDALRYGISWVCQGYERKLKLTSPKETLIEGNMMLRKQSHIKEIKKFYKGEIYLHGSRRMAEQIGVTNLLPPDTDYDYSLCGHTFNPDKFANYCYVDEGRNPDGWKSMAGNIDMKEYTNSNTVGIYEKTIAGDRVQIQIRRNLEKYKRVFESLNPSYYFDNFYKKNRKEFREWIEANYEVSDTLTSEA